MVFLVSCCVPLIFGLVSYTPSRVSEPVFLRRVSVKRNLTVSRLVGLPLPKAPFVFFWLQSGWELIPLRTRASGLITISPVPVFRRNFGFKKSLNKR